jgi:hypothetical protein
VVHRARLGVHRHGLVDAIRQLVRVPLEGQSGIR